MGLYTIYSSHDFKTLQPRLCNKQRPCCRFFVYRRKKNLLLEEFINYGYHKKALLNYIL